MMKKKKKKFRYHITSGLDLYHLPGLPNLLFQTTDRQKNTFLSFSVRGISPWIVDIGQTNETNKKMNIATAGHGSGANKMEAPVCNTKNPG
jgi:hypothetical protein